MLFIGVWDVHKVFGMHRLIYEHTHRITMTLAPVFGDGRNKNINLCAQERKLFQNENHGAVLAVTS